MTTATLDARNIFLLVLPPLLWAGNAVVGRMVAPLVPPLTLNLLRWAISFLILLPLAAWALRPGSGLWIRWRRYLLLGLLSVGMYNSLQYLALKTSTPMNVTLVACSMPAFMLALGAMFFGQPVSRRQFAGAGLSMVGVLLVLARGDLAHLAEVRFVPGDLYMLLATAAFAWYSWLLTRSDQDDPAIRRDWAAFLLAQVLPGIAWSTLFTVGEWTLLDPPPIAWGLPLLAGLSFIVIGPSILAYRSWGLGVQRLGPNMASIFNNLTPLFAAVLSASLIGELPRIYHAIAFAMIVSGIVIASPRKS
ncbi:DMT family transporter [Ramlibacter rhizophilus]|uniref:DMT family transporter n=1 Tax=Ramlibacter rhizophilus TaxID=1781167 RepID=A0A4Z0BRE8_9BURK|nr:DMT family transporter [Ramlibacter rhizophilus]TFZ01401.1 DMT family transporter [Ramlibacter rhizophilus]